MLTRLRPWQAAAALTVVLVAVQVLLLLVPGDGSDAGAETPSALSPFPAEIAVSAASPVLFFAVLWLVFAVVARRRRRREAAQSA